VIARGRAIDDRLRRLPARLRSMRPLAGDRQAVRIAQHHAERSRFEIGVAQRDAAGRRRARGLLAPERIERYAEPQAAKIERLLRHRERGHRGADDECATKQRSLHVSR
jgi:hypothetical protein